MAKERHREKERQKGRNTQPPFNPSVGSLCHFCVTPTHLSYRFSIFETSATALCGTTGIPFVTRFPNIQIKIHSNRQRQQRHHSFQWGQQSNDSAADWLWVGRCVRTDLEKEVRVVLAALRLANRLKPAAIKKERSHSIQRKFRSIHGSRPC